MCREKSTIKTRVDKYLRTKSQLLWPGQRQSTAQWDIGSTLACKVIQENKAHSSNLLQLSTTCASHPVLNIRFVSSSFRTRSDSSSCPSSNAIHHGHNNMLFVLPSMGNIICGLHVYSLPSSQFSVRMIRGIVDDWRGLCVHSSLIPPSIRFWSAVRILFGAQQQLRREQNKMQTILVYASLVIYFLCAGLKSKSTSLSIVRETLGVPSHHWLTWRFCHDKESSCSYIIH